MFFWWRTFEASSRSSCSWNSYFLSSLTDITIDSFIFLYKRLAWNYYKGNLYMQIFERSHSYISNVKTLKWRSNHLRAPLRLKFIYGWKSYHSKLCVHRGTVVVLRYHLFQFFRSSIHRITVCTVFNSQVFCDAKLQGLKDALFHIPPIEQCSDVTYPHIPCFNLLAFASSIQVFIAIAYVVFLGN